MSVLKKEDNKVQSKYIKKHYISSQNSAAVVPEEEPLSEPTESSVVKESKYIKQAGREIGWRFEFNIDNPLVCIALASVILGVYWLATSGFGGAFKFPEIHYGLACALPIILYLSRKRVYFSKHLKPVYAALTVFACVIFISYTKALNYDFMLKMILMVTPPLTASYIGYSTKCIKYTSYIYVGMSLFFVIDYAAGGITGGWNGNTVGMYTLFGVVWLVFLGADRGKRNIILEIIVYAVTVTQMIVTNCRSVLVSLILFAVFMYLVPKALLQKKLFFRPFYIAALVLPFFIVIFMVWLYNSPYSAGLDEWSLEQTGKLFFSGREGIWSNIFDYVPEPIFGKGNFIVPATPHNSFLNIFVQIGYSGYFLFLVYFACIFEFLHKFFDDYIVRGSFIAFIVVYIANAFESILVAHYMLCTPAYLILAVGIGRACMLEKERNESVAVSEDV